jgi:fatty-acid desaturase
MHPVSISAININIVRIASTYMASAMILKLILINILDFLWLNAQVIQCLALSAVVKTYHQPWQVNSKGHSLMIAPCLA